MDDPICCCPLCGWGVRAYRATPSANDLDLTPPELWARQFRGLYHDEESNTVVLTGVGIHRDTVSPYYIASPDRDVCWSDDGYYTLWPTSLAKINAIKRSHAGIDEFVFHKACWNLLREANSPVPISLSRLLAILKSQPIPTRSGALNWGHDYGGATIVDGVNYFPWEDAVQDRTHSTVDPAVDSDPDHVPEIATIIAEEPGEPPAASLCNNPSTIVPAQGTDCFASVPMELRTAIAMHLPTADVLRLRLASRAFQPIFHSEPFWASRFATASSSDRGWLFEARHRDTTARRPLTGIPDWRWLYRRTDPARLGDLLPGRPLL